MAQSTPASKTKDRIGWIGAGRMGIPMVERLLAAGTQVAVWNRTRAKAEPLAKAGATIVDRVVDLADRDIIFSVLATGPDLEAVCFGPDGLLSGRSKPAMLVDFSTIGLDQSASIRERLKAQGVAFVASPVSGNGKVVAAGLLSAVMSGPAAACERARPYVSSIAPRGVAYAGEDDLARVCKIAHNVMLGVVIENLCEIILLTQKAGVPRHAFLDFLNASVMGSMFTRYKSAALVNLDWTPTFTAELLRKDLDLGLQMARDLQVPMPVTAATRELVAAHIMSSAAASGAAPKDFASLLETFAGFAGMKLVSENTPMASGLDVPAAAAGKS